MNPLFRRILLSPTMWTPAGIVYFSTLLGRKSATVRRNRLWISCGTQPGQGAYCAIAGVAYEPELRWLLDQLALGDSFIDVGANIGIYSLHAALRVGKMGRILAIEPIPAAVKLLQQNVQRNSLINRVTVISAAASDRCANLFMAGDPNQWNSMQLRIKPPGIPVEALTLDHICREQLSEKSRLKGVKIDAEGEESAVLRGAGNVLRKHRPFIVFENSFEATRSRAGQFLADLGYKFGFVDKYGAFVTMRDFMGTSATNVVAIPLT